MPLFWFIFDKLKIIVLQVLHVFGYKDKGLAAVKIIKYLKNKIIIYIVFECLRSINMCACATIHIKTFINTTLKSNKLLIS